MRSGPPRATPIPNSCSICAISIASGCADRAAGGAAVRPDRQDDPAFTGAVLFAAEA
jgi:hypothetical protein